MYDSESDKNFQDKQNEFIDTAVTLNFINNTYIATKNIDKLYTSINADLNDPLRADLLKASIGKVLGEKGRQDFQVVVQLLNTGLKIANHLPDVLPDFLRYHDELSDVLNADIYPYKLIPIRFYEN